MARKKQEIALQIEVETQEEWEEMLGKEGLFGKFINFVVFCILYEKISMLNRSKL